MPETPVIKTLELVKEKEKFLFRYTAGDEATVLDHLIELVNRRDSSFDWFDAAVMSHQLGQHLAKELKSYLPKATTLTVKDKLAKTSYPFDINVSKGPADQECGS